MGLNVRRGDFVVLAASGDYGKPRPALIVQSDAYAALPSVSYCPLTSTIQPELSHLRIHIEPDTQNGLEHTSQISIEKIATIPRAKIGKVIGHANDELMLNVTRALAIFLAMG